ncbi:hypothetical protein B0H34DRAFT_448175 [Crassisporium funariophilum]|nr:hypothetical protein B0H34DRAFT_448175 [Crassisporium funariophilum]
MSHRYFEDDDRPMLAGLARRRSWKSFRRTLPANLPLAPMDRISEQQQDLPIGLRSSAMRRSQILTLPLLTQPSPLRRRPSTSSIFSGSDQDADGESDNAGTDDEYVPSPEPTSNKRRRSYSSARRTEVPDRPASSFRDSVYLPHTTTKRLRVSPPSRNKQASAATSAAIVRVVNNNLVEKTNFICPECGWRQLNRRIPDFKRHLKTHLRAKDDDHNEGFWCKGVPVEDARKYLIRSGAEPYKFLDHHRVGGCMRTFSRRDALKRHLDNANIACISECMD